MSRIDDPDIAEALRYLGKRERTQPTCPRCTLRPQLRRVGVCRPCQRDIERERQEKHDRIKASKRRWWHENRSQGGDQQ